MERSSEVDAYIANQPQKTSEALSEIREYIWEAAPHVSEHMNYKIPAFALIEGGKREQQIMIAGYAKHIGFYPHPDTIEAFQERLSEFKYAKGSIQFPLNKPLPKQLIIEMVKFRNAQVRG
ncbi:iron chaperone [Reinekea blandensis]|uniref:YdhG-like domain-containing protein n=1 Tax=Reinekea blandensis MED297 TaxID=314283 RepID=A4BGG0_9GAMM|nr:DUF1801 domain-containing protein [Reinekea blandensis]EAR08766.1 hypothetical protein MED297_08881 [Reinekea sp. MED297] [Reinekea blandensis MED297]